MWRGILSLHGGLLKYKRFLERLAALELPQPKQNELLSKHTSFGIGGPAEFLVEVRDGSSLSAIVSLANELELEYFTMGGGTNLLVSDSGYRGLVIKICNEEFQISSQRNTVCVGAGLPTSELVDRLIESGLGGLEFAAGLPGTVGGAIAGNAGCFGHCLSDLLVEAEAVDAAGNLHRIGDKSWFCFNYRHSKLQQNRAVVTSLVFRVTEDDPVRLRSEADKYLDVRARKHPHRDMLTAGSYFKNLPPENPGEHRRAAGALLDQVGARSMSYGDAAVFDRHANIIINRGRATAEDVLYLAQAMKKRVLERFGVELEEEVRFLGEKPKLK